MELSGLTIFIISILYTTYAYYWLYNYVVRVVDFNEESKEIQSKFFQFFCMSITVSVILFWCSLLESYLAIGLLSFICLGAIYITLTQSKKLLLRKSKQASDKMIRLFLAGDRETVEGVAEKYKKMQDKNGEFKTANMSSRDDQIFYFAVSKALLKCKDYSS
ncbi:MAG TPA: hypothetical protein QF753_08580 [Victivallales bacterium]|nr:hypothetical protein [Victivallales bacterium]